MQRGRHINTERRTQIIGELAFKYYEPGNHAKCHKAVWKNHIDKLYPMCYRTYMSYINAYKRANGLDDATQLKMDF